MLKSKEISLYTIPKSTGTMGKGYQIEELKEKLIDVLEDSKMEQWRRWDLNPRTPERQDHPYFDLKSCMSKSIKCLLWPGLITPPR